MLCTWISSSFIWKSLPIVDKNDYRIIEDQEIEFILEEKENGIFLKLLQPIKN
jgi:uncharacterized protein YjbK